MRLCRGILNAARHFEHYRLPEVFAGFARKQFSSPVRYPVACHPQAWAAGSIPFMVTSLLGIVPEALEGRLRITRPVLPEGTTTIVLRRVKVGQGAVDLEFRRSNDRVNVNVLKCTGNISVQVDENPNTVAA